MTPEEAAASLDRELRQYPWYITTGIGSAKGSTALFVYTKVARTKTLSFLERGVGRVPRRRESDRRDATSGSAAELLCEPSAPRLSARRDLRSSSSFSAQPRYVGGPRRHGCLAASLDLSFCERPLGSMIGVTADEMIDLTTDQPEGFPFPARWTFDADGTARDQVGRRAADCRRDGGILHRARPQRAGARLCLFRGRTRPAGGSQPY